LYSFNPNFFLKNELQYELCIRGISSVADVQTLRGLFRSVVSEGLPGDLSNLRSLGVDELYVSVESKIIELQRLVTTEIGLILVDTKRPNQDLAAEGPFDIFDNFRAVSVERYDFPLSTITRSAGSYRAGYR
jgi:hypothetical protein